MSENALIIAQVNTPAVVSYSAYKKIEEERDKYKMMVDLYRSRRKVEFARDTRNARQYYKVERPRLPARIILGGYGLVICGVSAFFNGLVDISSGIVSTISGGNNGKIS